MEYRVLGPLEAVAAEGDPAPLGGWKQRAVLACLLAHAGTVQSTDQLIEAGWGDGLPANPRQTLQIAISRLRKVLGADGIIAKDPGYVVRLGADDLDSWIFERLTTEAGRRADAVAPAAALERCDTALALWRGRPFADFEFADFARGEIARLDELRSRAVELRLHALLALGRHGDALPAIESALDDDPLREALWGLLMLALYRSGRQAEALRTYQRATTMLGEELGIEPGADLRRLEGMMLLQDAELDLASMSRSGSTTTALPGGDVALMVGEIRVEADAELDAAAAAVAAGEDEVTARGGAVLSSEHGTFTAVFSDQTAAALASIAIQSAVPADGPRPGIGIHVATMRTQGNDYVGLGLSRARRIAISAAPGMIVASERGAECYRGEVEDADLVDQGLVMLPGMSEPEQLFIITHPSLPEPPVSLGLPRATNLPAQLSPFVGREEDIASVSRLVRERRLVTLTGPGGVGKTSLARQVAADAVGAFRDGVWFVELGPLEDHNLVAQTVAHSLGLEVPPAESAEALVLDHLQSNETLLVMDNCEHVVDAAAEHVTTWLAAAPNLRVLATSREALAVGGEQIYTVPAMAVPSHADEEELARLADVEAVTLLLTRVEAFDSTFELNPDNAADIATICRRLDGIPLAIELAASRFAAFPPAQIAARLDDRFEFLVSRQRGLPSRQRTLEAAIDWSYDLLTEPERVLLMQLSVFRGGFDVTAVEAICRAGASAVDDFAALVAKSLVVPQSRETTGRFTLLESIHAYAHRHSIEAGIVPGVGAAHAEYYADLTAQLGPEVWGAEGATAVSTLSRDLDNIRSALGWFLEQDPGPGLALVATVATFWQAQGLIDEGLHWAEAMIAAYSGEQDSRLANAMNAAGVLRYYQGDEAGTISWWDQSLDLAERFEDAETAARTASNLGVIATDAARYDDAVQYLTRAIAGFETIDDDFRASIVRGNLGVVRLVQGDLDAARTDFEAHLETSRRLDSPREEARALHNYGDVLRYQGKAAAAEEALRAAVASARDSNQDDYVPAALHSLAALLVDTGRFDEAAERGAEGLELAISADPPAVPDCLEVLAHVAISRGQFQEAGFLIGAAHRHRGDWEAKVPPAESAARKERADRIRVELGAEYDIIHDRGAAATPEEALAQVRSWSVPAP